MGGVQQLLSRDQSEAVYAEAVGATDLAVLTK